MDEMQTLLTELAIVVKPVVQKNAETALEKLRESLKFIATEAARLASLEVIRYERGGDYDKLVAAMELAKSRFEYAIDTQSAQVDVLVDCARYLKDCDSEASKAAEHQKRRLELLTEVFKSYPRVWILFRENGVATSFSEYYGRNLERTSKFLAIAFKIIEHL